MANAVNHHDPHVAPGATSAAPALLAQPQRRGEAGHAESRDSLNELLERSRAIARQAATTLVTAFKEVMADPAVAGGFAVESARDLVQYLLRRGELSPADAERLLKVAESSAQRSPAKRVAPAKPVPAKPIPAKPAPTKPVAAKPVAAKPVATKPVATKPVAVKAGPAKPAVKASPAKRAAKPAAAARKPAPAAKKGTAKKAAAPKSGGKPSVKKARR